MARPASRLHSPNMDLAATGASAGATSDASLLLLRKAMDTQKAQAQSLLQSMLPPPALGPGKGRSVDVYA